MPILPELPDHDAAWKALQAAEHAALLNRLLDLCNQDPRGIAGNECSKLPTDLHNFGGFKKAVGDIVFAYPGLLDPEESLFLTAYKLEQHAIKLRRAALPNQKEKVGPAALETLHAALRVATGTGHSQNLSPEERLRGIADDVRHFLTEVADRG